VKQNVDLLPGLASNQIGYRNLDDRLAIDRHRDRFRLRTPVADPAIWIYSNMLGQQLV
jgi:hypothetical protein